MLASDVRTTTFYIFPRVPSVPARGCLQPTLDNVCFSSNSDHGAVIAECLKSAINGLTWRSKIGALAYVLRA
jgi:hypothetical protein